MDVTSAPVAERRPWAPERREANPLKPSGGEPFSCLSEVDLFADLTAAEIAAFDRMAPARSFRNGELIFSQSQPVTALFILKAGRVRIFRVTEEGKALTMAILEPGAVFGEMLLVGQRMYDNYAEAIEDAAICQLSVQEVERHLLSDPRIAIRISRLLGEQVVRLEERLTDLALRPLLARVAGTLVRLAASQRRSRAGHVIIRLTHDQLAGLLGATRESTSKAMADLASRGLIRQARGRIVLLDLDGLGVLSKQLG
ncbi:Crp/Fnr family transcriptional regulator [Agromyces sp. H66]|uniref:Crp/Fnr family transcriptional regulator n=1 Tax=Agromyces sp. H66 TaxID=2529859 RepID=UPI0010AACF7E|nr:Crp/Fnr family transcriptional regulator [Agromyces sp. H66]